MVYMSGLRVIRFNLSILVGKELKQLNNIIASSCNSIGYGFLIFVITSCNVSVFGDLDKASYGYGKCIKGHIFYINAYTCYN